MPIRVLLADDSQILLKSIISLFDENPSIELVGVARSAAEAAFMANDLKPDVIVLDLHMCRANNPPYSNIKNKLDRPIRVLAISLSNDSEAQALAEKCGADRLLDKMNLYSELIPAITQLACRY